MNMYKARFEPQQHMCKVNSSRDRLWWVQPHTHTRRSNGGKSLSRNDWCTYPRNREWKRKREKLGRILREDWAKWEEKLEEALGKAGTVEWERKVGEERGEERGKEGGREVEGGREGWWWRWRRHLEEEKEEEEWMTDGGGKSADTQIRCKFSAMELSLT